MSFLLSILSLAKTVLIFGIVLGIIVLIHEFGHYIAARLTGVRVEVFSFGFGKRLLGKQIGDTDFRLSLVPLGGYVKMAGEEEWDPDNLKPDEFQAKNRGQKMFILIMGPLMNLLLAFFIFTIINMTGMKVPEYRSLPPEISYVAKGSPAEKAGILPGDIVKTIDGKSIKDWEDLETTLTSNPDRPLDIAVMRDNQMVKKQIEINSDNQYHPGYAGIYWDAPTKVTDVVEDSPAAHAGLKSGDIILEIENEKVHQLNFSSYINNSQGEALPLHVKRGEDTVDLEVTPKKVFRLESKPLNTREEIEEMLDNAERALPELEFQVSTRDGYIIVASSEMKTMEDAQKYQKMSTLKLDARPRWIIGINMTAYSPLKVTVYPLFSAMGQSAKDLVKYTVLVFNAFRKMIVGKLSPKNLSGPMEIAEYSRRAMETGAYNFFMLIAFISLQLGIVNLFPIPALDGGHLMIYSIEAVLRKEFSLKVKNALMNIGFFILIALMAFVILNDVAKKLPNGWSTFWPF